MGNIRPAVFIGSSKEGLQIAENIQVNLDYDCEVTLWSQGVFGLSHGTLESLVDRMGSFDFAILVLTQDDLVNLRDFVQPAPRDNVLLELGICIGSLGRRRTFLVYDRSKSLKLPSDLAGVTPATFQLHSSGNLSAALGAPCTLIKNTIRDLGCRTKAELTGVIDQNTQFLIISDLLGDASNQFLIAMHEMGVSYPRETSPYSPGEYYEYAFETGGGGMGGFSMDRLCKSLPDAQILQQDLKNNITLASRGHEYAKWLIVNRRKSDYFASSKGGWGEQVEWLKKIRSSQAPNTGSQRTLGPGGPSAVEP